MKTTEDVRKEINEATKTMRETTRVVNEALCHAAGKLNKLEEEYNRGLNDCWRMIRRIYLSNKTVEPDRLSVSELDEIFDDVDIRDSYIGGILKNLTPQEALAKIRAWDEKREEERKTQKEAKPKIGDVVEITTIYEHSEPYIRKGVVLSVYDSSINIITRYGVHDTVYYSSDVTIKKTGEHVDILGVFEEDNNV